MPGGTYYGSYLEVDKLLTLQKPVSSAHEEVLFIIVHQAYELWFKQILHELNSVRALFSGSTIAERDMGIAVARLARVKEIQGLCLTHINVLETMSPLDFLAFRDVLYPASGFQSVQFRVIENSLGLRSATRLSYGGARGYCSVLRPADEAKVLASEAEPSLFDLIERWLERTPFLETEVVGTGGEGDAGAGSAGESDATPGVFSFWAHYRSAVEAMLQEEEADVRAQTGFTAAALATHLGDIAAQRAHFETLLDADEYEASRARGERRLSHRATQAALMITLFQHEPGLQLPYRLLCGALEIDELLGAWRARHAQMVHRMLGAKIGTGGSSGYSYLKATVDRHRIFTDFFNLATFLLPPQKVPPLPRSLRERLAFNFEAREPWSNPSPSPKSGAASASSAASVPPLPSPAPQPPQPALLPAPPVDGMAAALDLIARGRTTEAEPLLREAVSARRAALGATHSSTVDALQALAGLLADAGRHEEASPFFRAALDAVRPRVLPAAPPAADGARCPFGHG